MNAMRNPGRRRLLLATLAGVAGRAWPGSEVPAASAPAAAAPLDAFILAQMKSARIPGLAIGIAHAGRVTLARGYGFADLASRRRVTPDSMFHIASVTKPVTATAVMQLVEQGRMRLDDPVEPFLDFPVRHPRHADVPITFRHLLTHTAGISDERYVEIDFRIRGRDSEMPIGELLRDCLVPGGKSYDADKSFGKAAPGQEWDYSNLGFALLGYLATRIAGADMRTQATKRIFEPLGMRRVSWTIAGTPASLRVTPYDIVDDRPVAVGPVGFPDWSAGMLRASAADFALFLAASADGGASARARILAPDTLAAMLAMQQPAGLPTWLTGQGLGWEGALLDKRSVIEHWGGDPGVFTAAYLDPASRTGVAVFTNTTVSAGARSAVKAIAARLLADGAA